VSAPAREQREHSEIERGADQHGPPPDPVGEHAEADEPEQQPNSAVLPTRPAALGICHSANTDGATVAQDCTSKAIHDQRGTAKHVDAELEAADAASSTTREMSMRARGAAGVVTLQSPHRGPSSAGSSRCTDTAGKRRGAQTPSTDST
jgi:hypothetical protein